MTRVLVVIGTRPEAIKLAPVVRALAAARPHLEPVLCATAQHRDMLDDALELFGLRPDLDLDLMRKDQDITFVTTEVLARLGPVLRRERPGAVLVQGDTATAMASSLAAFYERIPVGHVEAGLRTADRYSPFPEEMMRRVITRLADLHFAATERAARTLLRESVPAADVYLTGNPVVDAVRWIRAHAARPSPIPETGRRLLLVTAHRRENFGSRLLDICRALRLLVERNEDIEIVYPVHPNPQVTDVVRAELGGRERIRLILPVRYDEFVALMDRAYLVLTDSGGIQEEAPVLGKPVLVLRTNTERGEALEANTAILVGSDVGRIVAEAERLLTDDAAYRAMSRASSPFGDGHAAERIVAVLLQILAGKGTGADEFRFEDH